MKFTFEEASVARTLRRAGLLVSVEVNREISRDKGLDIRQRDIFGAQIKNQNAEFGDISCDCS